MKRSEKAELIVARITKALLDELGEKTLDNLTSDEISRKASVSKRTLYKYFSSKKEMYLHLVKTCYSELAVKISGETEKLAPAEPWDVLECIGRTYFNYSLADPVKSRLMLSFNENDYYEEYPDRVEEIASAANTFEISAVIEEVYGHKGETPPLDSRTMALFLWAQIEGLVSLLTNKGSWIESYYDKKPEQLIEEQLGLLRKAVMQ